MDRVIRPITVFDSRTMPATEAMDAWLSVASPTFRIGLDRGDPRPFLTALQVIPLRAAMLTGASISAQRFERGQQQLRRDDIDRYGLFLQVSGSRVVRTTGTEVVLRPGDLQVVDMAQEEDSLATDGESAALYLPRDVVEREAPGLWQLHGTVIQNPMARIFSQTLLDLLRAGEWSAAMMPFLDQSIVSLALGCIHSIVPGHDPTASSINHVQRRQIVDFIDDRLSDFALGPETICEEFDLSRSVLYRLFQPHGGVHRFIRDRRLRTARRLLLAHDPRSMASLSRSLGFTSQSHFSREFRRAYGAPPTSLRKPAGWEHPQPEDVASLDSMFRLAPD
jgi:AraC-like DNA-binding protein